jgi:hypothetical protein
MLRQHTQMSESPLEPDIKTNYYIAANGREVPTTDSCTAANSVASYSITSSASATKFAGNSMPVAFAVLRLMTSL